MVHNAYYLARHGEATGNVDNILMGVRDFPLSDRGMAQADVSSVAILEEKHAGLKFTRAYSSPLSRAFWMGNVALGHAAVSEDEEGHKHIDYVGVSNAPQLTLDHRLLDRN